MYNTFLKQFYNNIQINKTDCNKLSINCNVYGNQDLFFKSLTIKLIEQ